MNVHKLGRTGRNLVHVLLDNSLTAIGVGEFVKSDNSTTTDGAQIFATAAAPLLGPIVAIVDKYGNAIPNTTVTAGTASSTVTTSVTTGAANTTTKQYYALVDQSKDTIYSIAPDADVGTTLTTATSYRGSMIDILTATATLDETTHIVKDQATPRNFYCHGLDPNNSANLLVSIALSERDSVYE